MKRNKEYIEEIEGAIYLKHKKSNNYYIKNSQRNITIIMKKIKKLLQNEFGDLFTVTTYYDGHVPKELPKNRGAFDLPPFIK